MVGKDLGKLKNDHYSSLMEKMNHLRDDESLCDFNIVVSGKIITAHRCVLVSTSEYFHSLILGSLKPDKPEVDLTSITDDIKHVEAVIDFMYTGEIELDDGNLSILLRLSSYLLIPDLRQFCFDHIQDNASVDTIVHYYLLANEFMESERQKDYANTIRTRFHDYLIFKKESLNITPLQLQLLINNCDIFEHCSQCDIISFVYDWVTAGKTENHELLGSEILGAVSSRNVFSHANSSTQSKNSDKLKMIRAKLAEVAEDTGFVGNVISSIKQCFEMRSQSPDAKSCTLTAGIDVHHNEPLSDNVDVLLTFVPKQHVLDFLNYKSDDTCENAAAYDICIYLQQEQKWYKFAEDNYDNVFTKMWDSDMGECYLSVLMADRVYFILREEPVLYSFDLMTLRVTTISFNQLVSGIDDFDIQFDVRFVRVGSNTLYLILRVTVPMNMDKIKVYFRCYQLTQQNTWNYMFRAPSIEDGYIDTEVKHREGAFFAVLMDDRSEMMFAYKADKLYMFVLSMDTLGTARIRMPFRTALRAEGALSDFWILQDKLNSFFIERCRPLIACKRVYKKQSREMVKNITEVSIDAFDEDCYNHKDVHLCYYNVEVNAYDKVWIFEGNRCDGSSLKVLSFDDKAQLTEHTHTPPPFSCVTTLLAGSVKRQLLNSLTPITTYLQV